MTFRSRFINYKFCSLRKKYKLGKRVRRARVSIVHRDDSSSLKLFGVKKAKKKSRLGGVLRLDILRTSLRWATTRAAPSHNLYLIALYCVVVKASGVASIFAVLTRLVLRRTHVYSVYRAHVHSSVDCFEIVYRQPLLQ
jgi:hypothetical protein